MVFSELIKKTVSNILMHIPLVFIREQTGWLSWTALTPLSIHIVCLYWLVDCEFTAFTLLSTHIICLYFSAINDLVVFRYVRRLSYLLSIVLAFQPFFGFFVCFDINSSCMFLSIIWIKNALNALFLWLFHRKFCFAKWRNGEKVYILKPDIYFFRENKNIFGNCVDSIYL